MIIDLAVAALVLALPLSIASARTTAAATHEDAAGKTALLASVSGFVDQAPRAQTVSRGGSITAATAPETSIADDVKPIVQYTLGARDTLQSVASSFRVTPDAIAYSNGITSPDLRDRRGQEIRIPPGDGALYTVKEGDTVAAIAALFKVDPKAIMEYNRLYFEPEHFGPGQLIYVPGATIPTVLVYASGDPSQPSVIARPAIANNPSPNGRLAWPVTGYISQYFWAYHTGVDLAAPYGTPIAASDAGTVVFAGYVAVGGNSIRIRHANGLESGYYHMQTGHLVEVGDKVERGQIVGWVGMSGITTGPHVHWELKLNGAFVNPLSY